MKKIKDILKILSATIITAVGLILTLISSNGIMLIGILLIGAGSILWTIILVKENHESNNFSR